MTGLNQRGFTTAELIVAVAILLILIAIAIPTYFYFLKVARSIEGTTLLDHIAELEEVYYFENGKYSNDFAMIGYNPTSPLKYYSVKIDTPDSQSFIVTASGNIDWDADLNIWTIDEKRTLLHVSSD